MGFRPLQGLPIMNRKMRTFESEKTLGFRPLQGLPIMNEINMLMSQKTANTCFRPLQGLPIMN